MILDAMTAGLYCFCCGLLFDLVLLRLMSCCS